MDERRSVKRELTEAWKRKIIILILGMLFLGFGYFILTLVPEARIGEIRVVGTNQLSREEVISAAGLDQVHNIVAVDREKVRFRLKQDVRVELQTEGYQWPFSYVIYIRERTVSAYIPTEDGYAAVDRDGTVIGLQRRFSYMSAPLLQGIVLPPLLVGEIVENESVRIGLLFLVQLADRDVDSLSELDISDPELINGFTLEGVPIYLGNLEELDQKPEPTSQVIKEIERTGHKVLYMDLKTKVPVVKFEE